MKWCPHPPIPPSKGEIGEPLSAVRASDCCSGVFTCKKATQSFEYAFRALPVRKMSGIGEALVLHIRQRGDDRIEVLSGSKFVVRALQRQYRAGYAGDELSEGRLSVGKSPDSLDPGEEDLVRIPMV